MKKINLWFYGSEPLGYSLKMMSKSGTILINIINFIQTEEEEEERN